MLGKKVAKISDSLGTLITYHSIRGGSWPTMAELHDRLAGRAVTQYASALSSLLSGRHLPVDRMSSAPG